RRELLRARNREADGQARQVSGKRIRAVEESPSAQVARRPERALGRAPRRREHDDRAETGHLRDTASSTRAAAPPAELPNLRVPGIAYSEEDLVPALPPSPAERPSDATGPDDSNPHGVPPSPPSAAIRAVVLPEKFCCAGDEIAVATREFG